ncbi:unnamed protein product [Effrenium voratum]|uniref:Calmodulin n=1 Tax=Effrenium voratum TaxID=2562239 RepID=A0AA36HQD2_9DINO|nr:unnamed protein product [Effrenium voratum]CAJ1427797.1 unnamed protein product [Effrenium voratum]
MCKIQPGQLVLWKQDDEDIPRGDIGEVIRLAGDGKKFSIQWPKGHWSMRIMEIEKLQFQKGDRVQWIKSDDDIPEGAIGVVMCVKYVEDSGQKLYVNFPSGRYSFWPHTLEAVNFDTDGAQQLKLTFKRFDANGDGKLSEEEFMSVLGKLGGGGGGLAPEECKQLFDALDKDDNGKLTVNEFIDYVLSDASQAAKMVLADGFGFDGLLGISDDEDDYDDEADEAGMKGRPCEEAPPLKSSYNPETSEGVDAETEVSKAEWATAMLTVGIPRAAALASFEAVVEELGGNQEVLRLEDLACELNGMGGAAGVEELRGPVGKVKHGEVEIVDLGTPSEEVDFERDLARKTGLDGLVFDLHYNNHSPQDAFKHLPKAKLSALERNILGEMSEEELVEAVLCYWESSATLSAVASWQRCRENCLREVQEIIDECKSRGEKYRDESFDPLENEGKVLWVDKKKPGWDNSVTQPDGWTSATEVVGVRHPCIHKKGASASDVEQGHIGNCFFVAAVAAMAGTRRSFLRQALVAYDMEVGVYGVMFCEEMHFVYEIVDDLIGTKSKHRFLYARSAEDLEELWVPIIEKAFFKHMTCLEMCDGGQTFEVIQSFLGGVWGQYHAGRKSHNLWDKVDRGCENGEVLTTSFVKPSKGPYANVEGEDGRCGEPGIGMGLVEGHAYSLLRSGEVDGHRLICSRNPWASHEWTGPWSDASNKWNDERRKKLGLKKRNDGTFWMEDKDFVQLSKGVKFNRTFGPTWQCCAQYGRFGKEPPFTALAKRSYRACEDGEINLTRGEKLEVTGNSGKWLYGVNKTTGKEGYFRSSDVDMRCEDTFKYELTFESVAEDARITVGVFRQDQIKCREWYKRKQDGQHYKDKYYPQADLHIYGSDGSRITKVTLGKRDRSEWYSLKPSLGPFKVYVSCKATKGRRFALYAFAPHGELRWKRLDCERSRWIAEVGEQMEMDNMRENIYSQASEALDDYIHLGYSLMKDYPGVASQVMDVAHTVGDLMNAGGVQQAADRVRDFVDSDQVQNLTNQVKDLMNSDQAQGMVDQVGGLMNRAKSLWG